MTPTVVLLIVISFLVLVLGFFAWRMTSSRGAIFATILCSAGLLLAGYHLAAKQNPQLGVIISFMAGMLLGGRGVGWFLRSRKQQPELRQPSLLLIAASAICIVGAIAAYRSIS
jgi:uncharacterized membrane protein (UPF0136 family)